MPADILKEIVLQKEQEVQGLYQQYSIEQLQKEVAVFPLSFYKELDKKAEQGIPFVITEFKRKSPSEGWINQHTSVAEQAQAYRDKGASAMSVLTDTPYFGGTYEDLSQASMALKGSSVLLLQKDFVIDPIQVYLARKNGANLILLIAAILEVEQMKALKELAERLGMGVLAEVHSLGEYHKVQELSFPVIGVNNRDLTNFKTALNCCNYIAQHIDHQGHIIAESGMGSALDLGIAQQHAQGFLIGTSLMRYHASVPFEALTSIPFFFKACGIRTPKVLKQLTQQDSPDLVGINFSPISKRRGEDGWLEGKNLPKNAVAVFKNNPLEEIEKTIQKYGFNYAQLYTSDITLDFAKQLKCKIILAVSISSEKDWQDALEYAPYIDLFLLDGAQPGSGKPIEAQIPQNFPYPFLLAGGMNKDNLSRVENYENCIGVDMASGIEVDGKVDLAKIRQVQQVLQEVDVPKALSS